MLLLCIDMNGCGATLGFTADPAVTTATGNFHNPQDTVPTSNGQLFYFTATSSDGKPTVYRVLASGGTADVITAGAPLVAPNGIAISADDLTLYIADTSAGLFKLSVPGGSPQLIAGTAANHPRGIDVAQSGGADVLYFTGDDPTSGQGGVFSIPAAGGAITTVAKGPPLVTPVGIVVGPSGTIYVSNPVAFAPNSPTGTVYQIAGGVPTQLASGLNLGYPAGVSLSLDNTTLVVSGLDAQPTGHAQVYAINLNSKVLTTYNQGISDNTGAGGLHRALKFQIFGWCGSTLGGNGTVYRVEF
jgi:sugar lactone lactonase YvrE